ncbi:TOBE domain-containing protein, partial [Candidatus Aerophobetes bacterium]|nr:TOBE domain-containing protein [Candidatus Aerophobetes bacterium]
MRAELLDLHQRLKTTAIYVTHDQLEAMTMGDRIVVMNEGLIQQVDTPQKVYDHPINRYVAGFIGSPSMNFLPCTIVKGNGDLYAACKSYKLRIPQDKTKSLRDYIGKEAILGIRPEHIDTKDTITRKYDPESVFQASVWVIEPLGSEKLVHIKSEERILVARLDPHVDLKPGQMAEFIVKTDFIHIFDKETEETIF